MLKPRPWSRFAAGSAIWLLVGLAAIGVVSGRNDGGAASRLARYALVPATTFSVELASVATPSVGDPLLLARSRRAIGRVTGARELSRTAPAPVGTGANAALVSTATWALTIQVDPEVDAEAVSRAPLAIGEAKGDARWALETLLPPRKRALLKVELDAFLRENGDLVAATLRPIAEETFAHGLAVLEKNLAAALRKHEPAIKRVLEKNRGIVKQDLLPVLKAQLGPSAREKVKPILTQIGRELWNELPMWTVSWRALVDALPGKRKSYIDEWWREFLDEKAIPIVKAHEDELVRFAEELVEEGARDAKVREALAVTTRKLAQDPEFKAVVRAIFEDAVVRELEPGALLERILASPEHRRRLDALEAALAPTLSRVARSLTIEEPSGRLDPDLARVLRRVVFKKDKVWVEVDLARGSSP